MNQNQPKDDTAPRYVDQQQACSGEREVLLCQLIPRTFRGQSKMLQEALRLIDDGLSLTAVAAELGWKSNTMKSKWAEIQDLVKRRFSNRLGVYWKGRPVLVRYSTDAGGNILFRHECE